MLDIKIAHISDVHIKNKYIEYYNLLDILHDLKPNIIVLTGDIIDSISNINPGIILDVTTFLSSLTSIAPIIMIPGNHDISCKVDDIDFFTAISSGNEVLKAPKFNYWRHSGQYEFNNILWTVIAPDEDIPDYGFDIRPQILLFHENLDRIDIETLGIFNAVMAGHIHNRHTFYDNAAYSGSLFQQTINESHNGHGFILWEIMDKFNKINFIDIKNDFGFLKVELEYDSEVTELPIPEKVVFYDIYYNNTSTEYLDGIINKYINIYGNGPRNIKNKNKYNLELFDSKVVDNSSVNINDIVMHNTLIRHYLKNKNEDDKKIQQLINLHKKYYMTYYNYQENNNGKIRLLSLFFENMYNFEGPNYIDFYKLENRLSGIIGPNNIGKTSLIDIILFALYDVHPRTSSKKCIINKNCNYYRLTLEFEINGKNGIINKGSTYKFIFDNRDYTQKTIPLTNNEIKKVVGNYNDAIISSFQLQYNYINFTNMTPTIRKQKLAEILSLHVFQNIETEVVKDITELIGKQKILNNLIQYDTIKINDEKIKDIQKQIKYANLLEIESNSSDNNGIECSDIKYYEQLIYIKQTIKRLEHERNILYSIINENKSLIIEYPNPEEEHKKYIEEKNRLIKEITELDEKINTFEPDYIKDAVINKYNNFGITYLYKLCKIEKDSKNLSVPAATIACLLIEKETNIKQSEICSAKIILCEKVINQLKYSDEINGINKTLNNMKESYNNLINTVNSSNKLYVNLFEEYKNYIRDDIEKYRQHELEIVNSNLELLKTYRQIIKPSNGIINILLTNILPKIEEQINNLLKTTNIEIKIDEDFEILYKTDGQHWLDISISSGYQKFILNIVFRIVLWHFADVVIPDALIIDEGFGMCDNENISIITDLLKNLTNDSTMPKLIFVISHVEYLINNIESILFINNGTLDTKHKVRFNESMLDDLIKYDNEFTTEFTTESERNLSTILQNIDNDFIEDKKITYNEFVTEVVPNCSTEVVHEFVTEVVPNCSTKVVPNCSTEVVPEFVTEVVPNCSTEVVPEFVTEVVPICSTEVVPEFVTEVVPNCSTEVVPESIVSENMFYCNTCDIYVKNSSRLKHLSSKKHKNNL